MACACAPGEPSLLPVCAPVQKKKKKKKKARQANDPVRSPPSTPRPRRPWRRRLPPRAIVTRRQLAARDAHPPPSPLPRRVGRPGGTEIGLTNRWYRSRLKSESRSLMMDSASPSPRLNPCLMHSRAACAAVTLLERGSEEGLLAASSAHRQTVRSSPLCPCGVRSQSVAPARGCLLEHHGALDGQRLCAPGGHRQGVAHRQGPCCAARASRLPPTY